MQFLPFGEKSKAFIKRPIDQDARITILTGAVRSSKTVTMIPKWIRYILEGPPGNLLMLGQSSGSLRRNVLNDFLSTIGRNSYRINYADGELYINGRTIFFMGAPDQSAEEKIRGMTLAGCYIDEGTLIPENVLKQIFNRLSVAGAKLYLTTNPDSPGHYLYVEYVSHEERLASGMVDVQQFQLFDNPNLDPEYLNFIQNAYQGLFYERMILGKWVMGEGAIYTMLSEDNFYEGNLTPHHYQSMDNHISVDYGTQNATVFLHIVDDGETVWVDREYYHSGRFNGQSNSGVQKTDSQYADDLIEFRQNHPVLWTIIDPSAASFKAELISRGILVRDADNEVLDGIRLTGSALHQRVIKINKRCVNLIRELQSYCWDPKPTEKGKEQPLKRDDHGPDALRYYIKTMISEFRLNLELAA